MIKETKTDKTITEKQIWERQGFESEQDINY